MIPLNGQQVIYCWVIIIAVQSNWLQVWSSDHDDMAWICFPYHWPCERKQSVTDRFPYKGSVRHLILQHFENFFDVTVSKLLKKQWSCHFVALRCRGAHVTLLYLQKSVPWSSVICPVVLSPVIVLAIVLWVHLQHGAVITWSVFSKIQQTPHSSPVRTRYGVSVLILKSDLLPATVIAVPYVLLWEIGSCYNGTWLYMQLVFNSLTPGDLN